MRVTILAWLLLACPGGCHWIQRAHLKHGNASSALALSSSPGEVGPENANISAMSTWRCATTGHLLQILQVTSSHPIPGDACFAGFTKFFWAAVLAMLTLVGMCLFVPLMLEITRRRPPGQPLVLCGIIFDCCPPKHSAEQLVTSPGSKSPESR
ncbi:unnamed protein product [Symbiodinium natans]|uniref:Uncharacterized protein n=1 Tax=Symbiodinium natans TaxID=878477 RepID=A0A812NTT7_9DINO|nr:unnamed protein product [Symbiodinium natans]